MTITPAELEAEVNDLLTMDRVARMADVHGATVRRAVDAGRLPGIRAPWGRLVRRADAEAWIAARKAAAA